MGTREEYEGFTDSVLNQWAKKIDDLETRARAKRGGELGQLKEFDFLKKKSQEAKLRFDELKASSQDWQNLVQGVDASLAELEAAFEKADSAVR
jgi:hypothetical protein